MLKDPRVKGSVQQIGASLSFFLLFMAVAGPLRAQETPRPSPREGPDTTCGPSYGSRPFRDSTVATTRCPRIGEPPSPEQTPAPAANVQVAPLSPKTDSLRQQAESTSRRPRP